MLTISKDELATVLDAKQNILIHGAPGNGKVNAVQGLLAELSTPVAYHSLAQNWTSELILYPPLDAEVLLMDDIHDADAEGLEVLEELLVYGTINGKALPKLKSVIGVYTTIGDDTISAALENRFTVSVAS